MLVLLCCGVRARTSIFPALHTQKFPFCDGAHVAYNAAHGTAITPFHAKADAGADKTVYGACRPRCGVGVAAAALTGSGAQCACAATPRTSRSAMARTSA